MCYTIPLAASIITTTLWFRKKESKIWWLNLMLYGGALFGIIDHLWHGELFLISASVAKDLSLGGAITATIFICWGIIIALAKISSPLALMLQSHPSNRER